MDLLCLLSGGKDSVTSACMATALGHTIVALANLKPNHTAKHEELDSHMFQTVGTTAMVPAIAKAWSHNQIRLFTADLDELDCSSSSGTLSYDPEANPDPEIEVLFNLIQKVITEIPSIKGCVSGAILSNYQRLRVESVCQRLNLVSFSPLWRLDQSRLLDAMIDVVCIEAILVKTAGYGLNPRKLLGKTIEEARFMLQSAPGGNPCGEGGEYETIVLNCPLFKSKLVVTESEIIGDRLDNPWDPCGHLIIKRFEMIPKSEEELLKDKETMHNLRNFTAGLSLSQKEFLLEVSRESAHSKVSLNLRVPTIELFSGSNITDSGFVFCASSSISISDMLEGWGQLSSRCLKDAMTVSLFVPNMLSFSGVNKEYVKYFGVNPPSRCCVEIPYEAFRGDCLFAPKGYSRNSLHVQSISSWAPACIGPYSQATECWNAENVNEDCTNSKIRFFAGQIALDPLSMKLDPDQTLSLEFERCIQHLYSVSGALDSSYSKACESLSDFDFDYILSSTVFCTDGCGEDLLRIWNDSCLSKTLEWLIIDLPHLPRDARVETQFLSISDQNSGRSSKSSSEMASSNGLRFFRNQFSNENLELNTVLSFGGSEVDFSVDTLSESFKSASLSLGSTSILRVYYDIRLPGHEVQMRSHLFETTGLFASWVPCLRILHSSIVPDQPIWIAIQSLQV